MKNYQLIGAFELEINKLNNSLEKPLTDDSLFWINQAVVKFTKERFNGAPPRGTSYEETEKRARDMCRLTITMRMGFFRKSRSGFPIQVSRTWHGTRGIRKTGSSIWRANKC